MTIAIYDCDIFRVQPTGQGLGYAVRGLIYDMCI